LDAKKPALGGLHVFWCIDLPTFCPATGYDADDIAAEMLLGAGHQKVTFVGVHELAEAVTLGNHKVAVARVYLRVDKNDLFAAEVRQMAVSSHLQAKGFTGSAEWRYQALEMARAWDRGSLCWNGAPGDQGGSGGRVDVSGQDRIDQELWDVALSEDAIDLIKIWLSSVVEPVANTSLSNAEALSHFGLGDAQSKHLFTDSRLPWLGFARIYDQHLHLYISKIFMDIYCVELNTYRIMKLE
jgi:hypothetical protein